MTLPSYAYSRDPAEIIEQADTTDTKLRHGCAACRHRGGTLLGKPLCSLGNNPGKRGYCTRWDLDEGWHDGP